MNSSALKLCVLIPCIGLIAACKEDQDQASTDVIKSVKIQQMKANDDVLEREISGVVATSSQSNLSFPVSGQVLEITVKSGETVEQGQALAKLDPQNYILALNAAKARVSSATAGLTAEEANLTRQKYLKEKDLVSQAAVEKAQTAYESALSQLKVAQSDFEVAKRNLDNTTLKAPFDGNILDRLIEPYAEVIAGQTVFELQGTEGLEVEMLMPETLVRDIVYGDEVEVTFPTLKDVRISGTVAEIGSKVTSGNAFPVSIMLAEQANSPGFGILPGMTAQVHLSLGDKQPSEDFYTIPISAIDMRVAEDETEKLRQGEARIFVYDPVTKSARHRTVLVRDVHTNEIVVYEGLTAGDKVITAGVPFLANGQTVQPWDPEQEKPARLNLR